MLPKQEIQEILLKISKGTLEKEQSEFAIQRLIDTVERLKTQNKQLTKQTKTYEEVFGDIRAVLEMDSYAPEVRLQFIAEYLQKL